MHIPAFDVPASLETYIHLRLKIDSSDGGLPLEQFRDMFGQCRGCSRFMMMRSKDHHRCLGRHAPPTLMSKERLFLHLDSTAGGPGLTAKQFYDLFASCAQCHRFFTRKAASYHSHVDDVTDDET